MKTKVCHIASLLNYSLFMESMAEFLDKERYEVSFVLMNPQKPPLFDRLVDRGIQVEWVKYGGFKDLPTAVFNLRKLFKSIQPDIVHTHLVDASLAGLTAAKLCGIARRVHTRHHSTECHLYFKHGVYYDRFISRLSRKIIATTKIVEETLIEKENVKADKVTVIPYGYDLTEFASSEAKAHELREKYDLTENYPVIGAISRFVEGKGLQFLIPAFAKIAEEFPKAKLVLANASGAYETEIITLLAEYLESSQYVLIDFEKNVFDLYKTFDVFVHVPINRDYEAFGQTYIESLSLNVPSVFTMSGVANDFIRDGENALVVPYCDSDAIFRAIDRLLKDDNLRFEITKQGKAEVENLFNGNRLAEALHRFYAGL